MVSICPNDLQADLRGEDLHQSRCAGVENSFWRYLEMACFAVSGEGGLVVSLKLAELAGWLAGGRCQEREIRNEVNVGIA